MISKQFLVTAIFMAFLAMGMSMIFRLQLAWPDETFPILESMIGKWGKDGKLDPGFYLGTCNYSWNYHGVYGSYRRVERNIQ